MSAAMNKNEWLEADGLGGFASGTVAGIRTRRYHGLLLTATTPPTGRVLLVNGFDAWVETPVGSFALSSQAYPPDVIHPDGARRIEAFEAEPWPRWRFRLEDGTEIEHDLFVRNGASVTVLSWRLRSPRRGVRLSVRPFLSGRDYHALHHQNPHFRFEPEARDGRLVWRPYPDLPGIVVLSNGEYAHQPDWYRNFLYEEERARGLDFTEDLASPGIFHCDLAAGEAVLILATEGQESATLPQGASAEACVKSLRDAERQRRGFASRLHRAAGPLPRHRKARRGPADPSRMGGGGLRRDASQSVPRSRGRPGVKLGRCLALVCHCGSRFPPNDGGRGAQGLGPRPEDPPGGYRSDSDQLQPRDALRHPSRR